MVKDMFGYDHAPSACCGAAIIQASFMSKSWPVCSGCNEPIHDKDRTYVSPLFIRESNLIEGIDDLGEDQKSWEAWEWFKKQPLVSQPVLLELHKRITQGQLSPAESGHYRQVQVYVGSHTPPSPIIAMSQMYGLLSDLMQNPENLDPAALHVQFEKIHPFVDGNGRTGRMLWWWHSIKIGQNPTLVRSNETDRHYYYQMFRENES